MAEYNHFDENVVSGNDPRMRFRNSQDPIYVAYDFVDNQPLSKLIKAFFKEQLRAITKFISNFGK
jgi:hypothetical protein